jgi:hypothetical protein
MVLKEQNVDQSSDYPAIIRNHTIAGQSRVYFAGESVFPIPINAGDNFEVLNNADGFNGVYQILAIANDPLLNQNYFTINKNYGIVATSTSATIEFVTSNEDYNVFEGVLTFLDVANGKYQVRATGTSDNTESWISEPIDLQVSHPKTVLVTYSNNDNAFDMTWTTGITGRIRVEAIMFKGAVGGERSVSREANYSLVKVNAKKTRVFTLETYMLPRYLHEKLAVIVDLDTWRINGVLYQTTEGYNGPQHIDRFPLSNSSVKIEQVDWFRKYNSNDITSVEDGGFIATETGFLKR